MWLPQDIAPVITKGDTLRRLLSVLRWRTRALFAAHAPNEITHNDLYHVLPRDSPKRTRR